MVDFLVELAEDFALQGVLAWHCADFILLAGHDQLCVSFSLRTPLVQLFPLKLVISEVGFVFYVATIPLLFQIFQQFVVLYWIILYM